MVFCLWVVVSVFLVRRIAVGNHLWCHLDDVTLSNYIIIKSLSYCSNIWVISESVSVDCFYHLDWFCFVFSLILYLSPNIVCKQVILSRTLEPEIDVIHDQKWCTFYFASLSTWEVWSV